MGKYKVKTLSRREVAEIEQSFKNAHQFITGVLEYFPNQDEDDDDVHDAENVEGGRRKKALPVRLMPGRSKEKKPARTVEELQARLSQFKGRPGLAYKEKLIKKGLKNRLKKKEKKENRKLKRLESKALKKQQNGVSDAERKPTTKPVYNNDGEMVFSKFDFSQFGAKADKKSGVVKDPKVALKKVREEQSRLKKLEEEGLKDQVLKIKEKKSWKKALMKSEGAKVKDDPELLKATLKKIKKRKEKSRAKWKANEARVEKEKEERQKKREANLDMRSKEKKLKKMRTQAKKGRIIAGF